MSAAVQINPKLDLVLDRVVDVPRELVWAAWTEPEHLKKWFTPAPWRTVECEIDLRPGGIFRTAMLGANGEQHSNVGCYLEIVPNEKLVWTSALGPAYRPVTRISDGSCAELYFTAIVTLEPQGAGTRYRALVLHGDAETCKKHEDMGFSQGWGTALDQMIEAIKSGLIAPVSR